MYLVYTSKTFDRAVEEFFMKYPSMEELLILDGSIKEMILSQVVILNSKRPRSFDWHIVKLTLIALLSIIDMGTDISMVFEYLGKGEDKFAIATGASILVNVLVQALVTGVLHTSRPWRKQLKEQFYVWFLIKPAVDAWRVAKSTEEVSIERGAKDGWIKATQRMSQLI